MNIKLKASLKWYTVYRSMDFLLLLKEIKNISFRFKDNNYQLLSIKKSKFIFYDFMKNYTSNSSYLIKFNTLDEVEFSLGRNFYNEEILEMVLKRKHPILRDPRYP